MSSGHYEALKGILLKQYALYPEMQLVDVVKLIYQSEFAGGHMIADEMASLQRLQAEWNSLQPASSQAPVFEELGDGLCRLNLAPILASGITPATINRLFVLSANLHQGNVKSFEGKLAALRQWCVDGLFRWDSVELDAYLRAYRAQGYPPVSHSEQYRSLHAPAYRVIRAEFKPYFELLCRIDQLMAKEERVHIAIDGNSGAGKTSLARLLDQVYDCNVIHMDHFFLPLALRTKARLSEAGGNIDYDRFSDEVLAGLASGKDFAYGIYDCAQGRIIEQVTVTSKQLNIIEGVYSMHPQFVAHYTLKVFLQTDALTQSERILLRNGAALHQRFVQEWIPLENAYFAAYKIAAQADLILSL